MKSHKTLLLLTLGSTALLAASSARAGGKPVKPEDVPAPATAAIKKWAGEGKVTGIVIEKEGGQTVYEAAVKGPGAASREVSVTAKGQVVSTEEIIAADQVPEAVRKAATEAAGAGKIVSWQRIVEGEVTTFEIKVERDGKSSEVEFTSDGKPKAEEDEADDEDSEKEEHHEKAKKNKKEKDDEEEDDDDEKGEKGEHHGKVEKGKKDKKDKDDDEEDDDDEKGEHHEKEGKGKK